MESGLVVPTSDEKDFCQFCYGAVNLHLIFPLGRPELHSIIDNVIGISVAPEAQESFSLCDECIATMEKFITFRNKCRAQYEKTREAHILNEAAKRMFPMVQNRMNHSAPSAANVLDKSINNAGEALPNVSLVEATPKNNLTQPETDHCSGSARKRSLDFDADSSAKMARNQNGSRHKTNYLHIREIMNRFRINRLYGNCVANGTESSPVGEMPNRNGSANNNSSKDCAVACKPCVVLVRKCLEQQIDLCKS